MIQKLKLRAQLILVLVVAGALIPLIGQPAFLVAVLVVVALQGVQLEINRD